MNWSEIEVIAFLRRMVARSEVRGPTFVVRKREPRTPDHGPQTPDHGPRTTVGIGDDAAVLALPRGQELLVTTDLFVENVHFRRDGLSPQAAGRRALARAVSDIAAMGGTPAWAFLSLALPGQPSELGRSLERGRPAPSGARRAFASPRPGAAGRQPRLAWPGLPWAGVPARTGRNRSLSSRQAGTSVAALLAERISGQIERQWIFGFLRGFAAEARRYGVCLAGGDTGSSGSPVFLADVVVCGTVPAGTAVLRSGAQPGDVLFVSGRLGAAAAALAQGKPLPLVRPRLELGRYLREHRLASAMIDLSDGLSTDLAHICEESGTGAEMEAARIPAAGTLAQALHGGEDYELLFTVPARRAARLPRRLAGVRLTAIGRIVKGRHVYLLEDGRRKRVAPAGWEHRGE